MKKILSFLLIIIGLCGYSQDEYYRKVDWKFYPDNVVQLTDSTYLTNAIPFDYNDVGAIQRVVGNYVVDFVGHRYEVIDSTTTTITVLDIYHIGQAPQTGQIARCYRSVGDGEAEYIGSIDYSPLDESSRWKLNGSDNELLWRQTLGKAENGLYKDLRTAKLGGNLIEPTTIDQDNNSFKILNNGHGSVFSETGIAYTKIDTVDFTDSTLVTKMYVKSLIKEGTSHDSLTIAPGSTGYFDVNYPQIFSGQKLIDSLGVINTKIAGKEPTLTKGNLTAGSSKVTIGGTGTNALIGTGASVDVNEANIVHQNLSGSGTNTHAQIDTDLARLANTSGINTGDQTLSSLGAAPAFGSANYVQVSPASTQSGFSDLTSYKLNGNNLFGSMANTFMHYWDGSKFMPGNLLDVSTGITRKYGSSFQIWYSESAESAWSIRALSTENSIGIYNDYTGNVIMKFTPDENVGIGYSSSSSINDKLSVNGSTNSTSYKLSGVDLFGSLTTGSRTKWDGTKLIDDTDTFAPAFSGTANYIPKFGLSGATLENSQLSQSGLDYLILDNQYAGILFKKSGANKFIFGDDAFLTATRPDAYGFYLYGDNVIDFWTNSTRIATFGQSSGIQFPSLAGSDTRLVASQSDGKLVNIANASGYLYNDGTNMSFTAFPAAVTSISAGNGMNFTTITGTGSVVLGTPTTLTASTTNAVTTTSHTHRITGFLPLTGGTLTGAVTSNNSFTGTNFILSSDKRLKQGIRTLTNTDWVERIKFVRYEMKSDPETERYGVIAQDVEEVNKYLVYTDENGIKSVSYIDLLVAKIVNLEKRISELENKKKRHEK